MSRVIKTIIPIIITSVTTGYFVGRIKPIHRLVNWNLQRAMWGYGKGQDNATIASLDGLLWVILHPSKTIQVLNASGYKGTLEAIRYLLVLDREQVIIIDKIDNLPPMKDI